MIIFGSYQAFFFFFGSTLINSDFLLKEIKSNTNYTEILF